MRVFSKPPTLQLFLVTSKRQLTQTRVQQWYHDLKSTSEVATLFPLQNMLTSLLLLKCRIFRHHFVPRYLTSSQVTNELWKIIQLRQKTIYQKLTQFSFKQKAITLVVMLKIVNLKPVSSPLTLLIKISIHWLNHRHSTSLCLWAWRLSGKFSALHPEGWRFESHSSRHIGTLGKSFTHSRL